MESNEIRTDPESRQAALLLERLETLRGELGMVGEELINLLRNAGAAEPDSACRKKPETANRLRQAK
jgi:hypothetical protein